MQTTLEDKTETIVNAISDKVIISFRYGDSGKKIIAEPYLLGMQQGSNKYVLLAFECSFFHGPDDNISWKLFDIESLNDAHLTGIKITPGRIGFEALAKEISEFAHHA